MFVRIIQALIDFVVWFAGGLISLLPNSPFSWSIQLPEWAGWIGYFVPWQAMLTVLGTYLVAVGSYYVVRVALRWIRAIG